MGLDVAVVEPDFCFASDMCCGPFHLVIIIDASQVKHTFTILEPLICIITIKDRQFYRRSSDVWFIEWRWVMVVGRRVLVLKR
jgi:hypothetical protein